MEDGVHTDDREETCGKANQKRHEGTQRTQRTDLHFGYFVPAPCANDATLLLLIRVAPVSTKVGSGAVVLCPQLSGDDLGGLWCRSSSRCSPKYAMVYGFCAMVATMPPLR